MEKKMNSIKKALKGDIWFVLIMGLVFVIAGLCMTMDVIRLQGISSDKYEVKYIEDEDCYALTIDQDIVDLVDYNTYSEGINYFPEEGGKYIKAVYIASQVDAILRCVFIATIIFLMYIIFQKIEKGISPFQRSSVKCFRVAGFIIFFGGIVGALINNFIVSIFMDELFLNIVFDVMDMAFIVLGVIMEIIGEIFKYGCELQEDSDLIA
jgi:hypothetical protein